MTTAQLLKCACNSCLCVISLSEAILKDSQAYCSDACAQGHPAGQGCGHTGCACGAA